MMVFRRRAKILRARQFLRQVGGFVDQHRQTLRANIYFVALVFDGQERFFLLRGTTIQANIIFHIFSDYFEITKALVVIERLS
jgi:hypothetical protein